MSADRCDLHGEKVDVFRCCDAETVIEAWGVSFVLERQDEFREG